MRHEIKKETLWKKWHKCNEMKHVVMKFEKKNCINTCRLWIGLR
jgi:hypothetical protein